MSTQELKALARKHWQEWLPAKVARLKKEGKLDEALQGAANSAQDEIEHLKRRGYSSHEAREVALPQYILLTPEGDGLEDWEREELAEMEREYQKNPPSGVITDADSRSTIGKSSARRCGGGKAQELESEHAEAAVKHVIERGAPVLFTEQFHWRQSAYLRGLAMKMKPGAKRRRVLQLASLNDRLARLQYQSSQQKNDIQASKPFTESTAAGEQSRTLPTPRSEAFSMAPSQLMTDILSERMAELLSQSPHPRQEMTAVDNLLENSGFLVSPRRESPATFSRDVFEGATTLVLAAEQMQYDPASAETAEDLILRLLPSDGHLD